MKRKHDQQPAPKKPKIQDVPYHLTPSIKGEDGEIIWPAPKDQMEAAREVIVAW